MNQSRPSRWITGLRLLFILDALAALVLGYLGMERFVASMPAGSFGTGFWNTLYYALQLFVLGSDPLETPGPYPLALELARFMAPAATIYGLFEAGRTALTGPVLRWWRRNVRRGHVIITGDTTTARAVELKLRAQGLRIAVLGDGSEPELRAAGVAGASAVYACAEDTDDSTTNVSTALAAAKVRRRRLFSPRLGVHVQVSDALLALGLSARRLGLPRATDIDVDFYTLEELAARGVMDEASMAVPPGVAPHILVAGLGTFGKAVVVEYARQWRLLAPDPGRRVRVTLVGARADQVAAELADRWDVVAQVMELDPIVAPDDDTAVDILLRTVAALDHPAHRTYLCDQDEDLALRTAMIGPPLWRGGRDSLVVRLTRHGEAFRTDEHNLLDNVDGRLKLVGITDLGCDAVIGRHDLVERLAQTIHEQYLLELRGSSIAVLPKPVRRHWWQPRPQPSSAVPWAELDESFKLANRGQADDIGGKLEAIGATVAPRLGPAVPFEFSATEVDELARREHERWCRERTKAGWTYAKKRDNLRKHHDLLVPWAQLSTAERKKDRDAVLKIPLVLAEVGLQPVRLGRS
jgi:hypothetical protein